MCVLLGLLLVLIMYVIHVHQKRQRERIKCQFDVTSGMKLDGTDEVIGDVVDDYLPNQGSFAALPRMDMDEMDERSAPPRVYIIMLPTIAYY